MQTAFCMTSPIRHCILSISESFWFAPFHFTVSETNWQRQLFQVSIRLPYKNPLGATNIRPVFSPVYVLLSSPDGEVSVGIFEGILVWCIWKDIGLVYLGDIGLVYLGWYRSGIFWRYWSHIFGQDIGLVYLRSYRFDIFGEISVSYIWGYRFNRFGEISVTYIWLHDPMSYSITSSRDSHLAFIIFLLTRWLAFANVSFSTFTVQVHMTMTILCQIMWPDAK